VGEGGEEISQKFVKRSGKRIVPRFWKIFTVWCSVFQCVSSLYLSAFCLISLQTFGLREKVCKEISQKALNYNAEHKLSLYKPKVCKEIRKKALKYNDETHCTTLHHTVKIFQKCGKIFFFFPRDRCAFIL